MFDEIFNKTQYEKVRAIIILGFSYLIIELNIISNYAINTKVIKCNNNFSTNNYNSGNENKKKNTFEVTANVVNVSAFYEVQCIMF